MIRRGGGAPNGGWNAADGQEEVFSPRAIERGLVKDPKALGPEDLAKTPKSPGRLTDDA